MDLMELYRSILKTAGVSVDATGRCWWKKNEEETLPFVLKQKQLVLPYRENLLEPDNTKEVFFHPFNQSAARGPSDVLDVYRAMVMNEINAQIGSIFLGMADMVVSTDRHKELSAFELDLISPLKEFDDKLLATLTKVVQSVPRNSTNDAYVSAFVKKGGVINGHKYKFICKVTWPVFEELTENQSCGGVALKTKKAVAAFANLFGVIGVTAETADTFTCGSDSSTAPAFESLLGSISKIVTRLNEIVENSPAIFSGLEPISMDWVEAVSDMQQFAADIKKIPIQNGNLGNLPAAEPVAEEPVRKAEVREEPLRSREADHEDRRERDEEDRRRDAEARRRASGFNPTPPPAAAMAPKTGSSLAERAEAQKRKLDEQNRRLLEDAERRRRQRDEEEARYYGAERQAGRRDDYYDRRDYRDDRRGYRDERDDRGYRGSRDNPFMDRVEDEERSQRRSRDDGRGRFGGGYSSGGGYGRGRGGV